MASTKKREKRFTLLSSARYPPRTEEPVIDERKLKDKGEVDVSSVLKILKQKREKLCSFCDKEPVSRRCYPCKCANACTECSAKAYKKFILGHKKDPKKFPSLPSCVSCDKDVEKTKEISEDKQINIDKDKDNQKYTKYKVSEPKKEIKNRKRDKDEDDE